MTNEKYKSKQKIKSAQLHFITEFIIYNKKNYDKFKQINKEMISIDII